MGRGVGHLMKTIVEGEVESIETLSRLRSWMELEAQKAGFDFDKTKLITDYDESRDVYKFKLLS